MSDMKRVAIRFGASVLVVPIIVYAGHLFSDMTVKTWKIGWLSRPLTFISAPGIVAFVVYIFTVVIILILIASISGEKFLGYLAIIATTVLFLYALSFATSGLGVM